MERRVAKVSYKLKLLIKSKIHPIFYVSLLKKKLGKDKVLCQDLPILGVDGKHKIEPYAVMDKRMVRRKNRAIVQWLIR